MPQLAVLPVLSALRYAAAIAASLFVIVASFTFLTATVVPAVEGLAVLRSGDGQGLDYVANLEPIPAGSITALAPLPKGTVRTAPMTVPGSTASEVAVASTDAAPAGERRRVTSGVNVRRDASSRAAVVGTLRGGETVRVLDSRHGWQLVEYASGIRGWVYGRYLAPD